MTSKKCLVMNLKLGRTRTPTSANALLDKSGANGRNVKRPLPNALNNNISTSPNHNAYLPLLPKYTEAAAALLHSSITGSSGVHPFYLSPSILHASNHAISPYSISVKSEGLAAKLEDAVSFEDNSSVSGIDDNDDDADYERTREKVEDLEMDGDSITTTDHVSEDGRKVRVRSLISDEQQQVLKDHYAINPRPKREELVKIAETVGFPVRVVQVWFQNARARDRREGRVIQVPYNTTSVRFPCLVPSNQTVGHKMLPLSPNQYISEQPLDLSTKKGNLSSESSLSNSPQRPTSVNHQSDDEVVNLSHKSSRSPTPYKQPPTEPYHSPSPTDFSAGSRLAQILAQPAHKLPIAGMGLVPMDQLMQFGTSDLPSLSQLINTRISSLSPSSEKTLSECNEGKSNGLPSEEEMSIKVPQFVLKSLGSPVLGSQESEPEGQFTCDQCDKAFSKQSSLARHKYEHSGKGFCCFW